MKPVFIHAKALLGDAEVEVLLNVQHVASFEAYDEGHTIATLSHGEKFTINFSLDGLMQLLQDVQCYL